MLLMTHASAQKDMQGNHALKKVVRLMVMEPKHHLPSPKLLPKLGFSKLVNTSNREHIICREQGQIKYSH